MTTYSKETALYDTSAIADDIEGAGNAYKAVITEVGTDGVKIHPNGQDGSQAHPITDYTLINDDGLEVFDGGTSVAAFGEDGARIGQLESSHTKITPGSINMMLTGMQEGLVISESSATESVTAYEMVAQPRTVIVQIPRNSSSTTATATLSSVPSNATHFSVNLQMSTSSVSHRSSMDKIKLSANRSMSHSYGGVTVTVSYTSSTSQVSMTVSSTSNYTCKLILTEYLHAETTSIGVPTLQLGSLMSDEYPHGKYSSSFGKQLAADGNCSHAEGYLTRASGNYSHGEGYTAYAAGDTSHAEGRFTQANAYASHAQNFNTIASSDYQTAIGKLNVEDANDVYAFIIGNGASAGARSNAATIDWTGNYMAQAMAGIIQMFAGSTPPTGWLVCDGSAVSRTTYATLFAAIGTTWGAGDGSTTFNLPDLRGRAPIGAGSGSGLTSRTLGTKAGAESVTLTSAQSGVPAHGHGHTIGVNQHAATACTRTTNVALTNNHSVTQPEFAMGMVKTAATGTAQWHACAWGDKTGQYTASRTTNVGVAAHSITQPTFNTPALSHTVTGGVSNNTAANASAAHNNMPPFAVINFIICTGKTS